jgi:hypothetical protein
MVLTGFIFLSGSWRVHRRGGRFRGRQAGAMVGPGAVLILFLFAKIVILGNCRFGKKANGRKLSVKKRMLSMGE